MKENKEQEGQVDAVKQFELEAERAKLDLELVVEKLKEKEDSYLRLAADFDNQRKRNLETARKSKEDGAIEVISRILPALDTFAIAKKSITDENTLKGLSMIRGQFLAALKASGVIEVCPLGSVFDPKLHEAISSVEVEKAEDKGKVVEVLKNGYVLDGRIIRYASVVVGK